MSLKSKCSPEELYTFQMIQEFITSLHDYFGSKCHSLSLYFRLVSKLTFQEKEMIDRHLRTFRTFCVSNREGISSKDISSFSNTRISFSDRIYVDLQYVFTHSDEETHAIIWEYLLLLSALVDPASKAKEMLKDIKKGDTKEGEFLGEMMETIQSQLGSGADGNPMEMIGSLMSSDMIGSLASNLQSNLQSGQLDMAKLMGTMQGLVQKVGDEVSKSDDPMIKNMFSMLEKSLDKNIDSPPQIDE